MNYEEMEKMMEEMMQDPAMQQIFQVTMIITLAVMAGIWVTTYILGAIGVRRLSARTGIAHPALAFVPILRWAMLGKLAELKFPFERKTRKPFAYSAHLPVLMTLSFLLQMIWTVPNVYYEYILTDAVMPDTLARLMNGVSVAYQIIYMIGMVILLMATTRIFTMTRCSSPMLMSLLVALIPYALPIILFVCRNRPFIRGPHSGEDSPADDQPPRNE